MALERTQLVLSPHLLCKTKQASVCKIWRDYRRRHNKMWLCLSCNLRCNNNNLNLKIPVSWSKGKGLHSSNTSQAPLWGRLTLLTQSAGQWGWEAASNSSPSTQLLDLFYNRMLTNSSKQWITTDINGANLTRDRLYRDHKRISKLNSSLLFLKRDNHSHKALKIAIWEAKYLQMFENQPKRPLSAHSSKTMYHKLVSTKFRKVSHK